MDQKGRRIAISSGIAAAGIAAAGVMRYITLDHLGKVAFDRECPRMPSRKNRQRLTGAAEDPAFSALLSQFAYRLRKRPSETICISARDGEALVGHWIAAPEPKRIIIAMHGWRSSWDHDFGMIADFFLRNGCSVLYAEQRGQNGSGGECIGFGVLERFDCLEWVRWAVERTEEKLPVYLVGISMGATTVMLTSELELSGQVKGIIADCGFTSIHDISQHVLKNNLGLHYGISGRAVDNICRKRLNVGAKEHSTVLALQKTRIPLLLVHGAKDSFVPVSMAYENYNACNSPRQLLIVPKADHGMSYYLDRQRYEAAVRSFWSRYDD